MKTKFKNLHIPCTPSENKSMDPSCTNYLLIPEEANTDLPPCLYPCYFSTPKYPSPN